MAMQHRLPEQSCQHGRHLLPAVNMPCFQGLALNSWNVPGPGAYACMLLLESSK
jgi:hypothetical protein